MHYRHSLFSLGVAALGIFANPARAQDASFGCKVLLCAAASMPGWSAIPYCVPVMQSLFRQLARGKPGPVCSEGHASAPGYEPYEPCPDGWVSGDAQIGGSTSMSTSGNDAAICIDPSRPAQNCETGTGCKTNYPSMARTARENPYFVDIATAAGTQRFYFSLRGY